MNSVIIIALSGLHALLFLAAVEFSERMSNFGLAANLIIYLTKVLHQDLKTAAKSANYWTGVTTMMPLLGGFLADAYLGRFSTVFVSSMGYLLVAYFPFLLDRFQQIIVTYDLFLHI